MAIDTFATLKTAISDTVKRANLTPYLENIILLGEKKIFRKVRAPEMETSFSDSIASGTTAVPTGFLSWKWVAISGSPQRYLQVRTAAWVMENYPLRGSDAKPFFIARDGANFIYGPYADGSYTVVGTYYKRPTTILSEPNDLFLANPDLYLFAALSETEAFIKNDKRIAIWQARRDQIIQDINEEGDESDESGSLQTTVDFSA